MAGTEKSENSNISDCMMGNDQHSFLGLILAYSVRNISYSAVVKKVVNTTISFNIKDTNNLSRSEVSKMKLNDKL